LIQEASLLEKMNILVVDDSPMIHRMCQGTLVSAGLCETVLAKYDGAAGLAEICNNFFDLVILDWNMPEMDGIDVLLQMRNQKIPTPVIMCTSEGEREDIINAVTAGANDYLVKPFKPIDLEEKVRKVSNLYRAQKGRAVTHRAMVVDDSPVIRKNIKQILLNSGRFTVVLEAENGKEVLNKYRRGSVDIVFMDWEMPGINGVEAMKQIRQIDTSTPIIMVTSNSEIEHMVEAFDSGATNFIPKPFEERDLVDKVNQVL
jgi:two-component system chemotaxis response regulator CheY